MKTKEEILKKHCDGEWELGRHPSDSTYCEIDGAIDGRTAHVLSAMEEYAEQQVKEALYKARRKQEEFDYLRDSED